MELVDQGADRVGVPIVNIDADDLVGVDAHLLQIGSNGLGSAKGEPPLLDAPRVGRFGSKPYRHLVIASEPKRLPLELETRLGAKLVRAGSEPDPVGSRYFQKTRTQLIEGILVEDFDLCVDQRGRIGSVSARAATDQAGGQHECKTQARPDANSQIAR